MNPSDAFKRAKAFFHSLSKTNTESTQYVFESMYKSGHTVRNEDIWAEDIDYAADSTQADSFVSSNPSVVKKYNLYSLTEVPGSNGQAYYLSDSGSPVRGWINPVDVSHSVTSNPSFGYIAKLYQSDNTFIPPTSGVYVFDYYSGLVLFQEGYTPSDLGWGNPKITCYVYIGERGGIGGISETDPEVVRQVEGELNFDSPSSFSIVDLPDGSIVDEAIIDVITEFNGTTESTLIIGDDFDDDSIVKSDESDLGEQNLYIIRSYVKNISPTSVNVTFNPGVGITEGRARILIQYSLIGDGSSSSSSSSSSI